MSYGVPVGGPCHDPHVTHGVPHALLQWHAKASMWPTVCLMQVMHMAHVVPHALTPLTLSFTQQAVCVHVLICGTWCVLHCS